MTVDKCPICDKELIKAYEYGGEYGLEESKYECEGHYAEVFSYGATEIHIGDFITGYRYDTDQEKRTKIYEIIQLIAERHKPGVTGGMTTDQIKKEIVEDLAHVGNDVATVATHGNLLRAVSPLIKTCRLTNSEVAEFLDLSARIVERMEKEVQGCQK